LALAVSLPLASNREQHFTLAFDPPLAFLGSESNNFLRCAGALNSRFAAEHAGDP
jgi:hypothetical protein